MSGEPDDKALREKLATIINAHWRDNWTAETILECANVPICYALEAMKAVTQPAFSELKLEETGDANFWRVMDRGRWIAVIQFNGELMEARQVEIGRQLANAAAAVDLLAMATLAYQIMGKHRLGGADQNPHAIMDRLGSAILKAGGKL
jgi:hypothetical protein